MRFPSLSGLRGHAWTVWPHVRDLLRPAAPPPGTPWATAVTDPVVGRVRLSGIIDHVPGADRIVVVLHGMGGHAERPYCAAAAVAARAAGMSSMRMNLRGADGSGEDFYHIGLIDDLQAALAHEEVARYREVFLVGFSLGGHVALRHALLASGGPVRAVASICAPLDLEASVRHIDHARSWVYRQHLLRGLKQTLEPVARRRPEIAARWPMIRAIRTVREWDERVVAPRFGFAGADDYYRTVQVGPRLGDMAVPALILAADADPMVPAASLRPLLDLASSSVEARWLTRAGHVGFPSDLEVLSSVVEWLRESV